MIVLLAGMPRSGSTFSFNVAREVLRSRGTVYQEACSDIIGAVHRSNGADHVLIKTHNLDAPSLELARVGAVRIIMTVRRVEDAMASWFEAFEALPEPTSLQIMREWLRLFQQLRSRSLIVPFDAIDRRPWLATWRIARSVCPSVSPVEVIRIAHRFRKAEVMRQADKIVLGAPGVTDIGFSHFDTATFFHRRHVSRLQHRPTEQRLPPEMLTRIRDALADDIKAAGLSEYQRH